MISTLSLTIYRIVLSSYYITRYDSNNIRRFLACLWCSNQKQPLLYGRRWIVGKVAEVPSSAEIAESITSVIRRYSFLRTSKSTFLYFFVVSWRREISRRKRVERWIKHVSNVTAERIEISMAVTIDSSLSTQNRAGSRNAETVLCNMTAIVFHVRSQII